MSTSIAQNVFSSLLFAAIFGVCCALLSYFLALIHSLLLSLGGIALSAVSYEGSIFSPPREIFIRKVSVKRIRVLAEICAFFKAVLFTLGFILLSYGTLDGEIRLYVLAVALAVYLALRKLLLKKAMPKSRRFLEGAVSYFAVFFRILLYFPLRIVKRINKVEK